MAELARRAHVAFDLPLRRSFTYTVPAALALRPGQRVMARLQGRVRAGVVVALDEGDPAGLTAIERALEPAPLVDETGLELARWAAAESLSALGATLAAWLPPPPGRAPTAVATPAARPAAAPQPPELWTDARRETRLEEAVAAERGSVLVIAPDGESVERWARRLDGVRLDAAAPGRWEAWLAAARGRTRVAVGTRAALLLPLPAPATLVLLDEHDRAHKPPGAPRLHSRDLLLRRAALDGSRLLLLAGAPAVETWWSANAGHLRYLEPPAPDAWPEIVTADTRGIIRNHPLTLPLTSALRDVERGGGRVALVATRGAPALGCDDCGLIVRCPECAVALAIAARAPTPGRRATGVAALACRLCGRHEPPPETCPGCGGRAWSQVGWGPDRVAASVSRRFPSLTVAAGREPWRAAEAQVLVGTPALLRHLAPGSVDAVGLVTLDDLLRLPDFRAGERALQILWAAAEATRPGGRVVIQTLHPDHYAVRAVAGHDRAAFYDEELRFREELGYPPFRRLCVLSVTGQSEAAARELIEDGRRAIAGVPGLTVYPPAVTGTGPARRPRLRCLIKGGADLPARLAEPLRPFLERRRRAGGMVDVEMDPIDLT